MHSFGSKLSGKTIAILPIVKPSMQTLLRYKHNSNYSDVCSECDLERTGNDRVLLIRFFVIALVNREKI
jgi:hypothetical protein